MTLRSTVTRVAARGVAVEPAATAEEVEQKTETVVEGATAVPPEAPKRRGRGPAKSKPKSNIGTLPATTGNESIPELRSKIKDVESAIKETRARHEAEMKALKFVYADLHSQMFFHVK